MNKTFEQVREMWEKDSVIDTSKLAVESANIPVLHHKYYQIYLRENLKLRKAKADYKVLVGLKTEYYKGEFSKEDLEKHGWPPMQLKILRNDVPTYVNKDPDVIEASLKIGVIEEVTNYVEEIIKQINNRGYQIKNAIDFMRFENGG